MWSSKQLPSYTSNVLNDEPISMLVQYSKASFNALHGALNNLLLSINQTAHMSLSEHSRFSQSDSSYSTTFLDDLQRAMIFLQSIIFNLDYLNGGLGPFIGSRMKEVRAVQNDTINILRNQHERLAKFVRDFSKDKSKFMDNIADALETHLNALSKSVQTIIEYLLNLYIKNSFNIQRTT